MEIPVICGNANTIRENSCDTRGSRLVSCHSSDSTPRHVSENMQFLNKLFTTDWL